MFDKSRIGGSPLAVKSNRSTQFRCRSSSGQPTPVRVRF